MTKDDALRIWMYADKMSLEELLKAYAEFQLQVNKTPNHLPEKDARYQNALHAAMGMVTEAGELLDPYKKNLYGKQKPIDMNNLREECGDMFYYLHAFMIANDITLLDILKDNVIKLANRYAENFS